MNQIELANLPEIASSTITTIFSEMVGVEATLSDRSPDELPDGPQVVSTIDLSGSCPGIITVSSDLKLARKITSIMMGGSDDEQGASDILDVIGELNNMIVGNLKTVMGNTGIECRLKTPSVSMADQRPAMTSGTTSGQHPTTIVYAIEDSWIVTAIQFEDIAPFRIDLDVDSADRNISDNEDLNF
jgi:CheY-specific phosphatase CheX